MTLNMSILIKKLKTANLKKKKEGIENLEQLTKLGKQNGNIINVYLGRGFEVPQQEKDAIKEKGNISEEISKIPSIGISTSTTAIPQTFPQAYGEGIPHAKIEEHKDVKERRVLHEISMKEPELRRMERIKMPEMEFPIHAPLSMEDSENSLKNIDIKYPLIPRDVKDISKAIAWAHIRYETNLNRLIYYVNEPKMNKTLEENLKRIEDILKESLDVNFDKLKKDEARIFLANKIRDIIKTYRFNLSEEEKKIVQYYAFRNFIGLDKLEPLMNDPNIEDISCDGYGIPIYVYHRNPKIGSVQTNIIFNDKDELDSFVIKLAQKCGRTISVAEPLLDGSLPDGSRVQATLGTDIARRGSNFTIRKFTEEPLTPIHLLNFGTVNEMMLSYFWMAIEHGMSILISGPTASGKTSLLNALAMFIRPELKIISIEDTPELRLPHPNWIPEVARSGYGFGSIKSGEVTLDDLLKESLRQRPDYIIVGEVRGSEAYILFQQMATGHPGLSTLHSSSLEKVIDRLTTKPINLPPSLIENLDIIVFIKRLRRGNENIRRVESVLEMEYFDIRSSRPVVNPIFLWNPEHDVFEMQKDSVILAKIVKSTGMRERDVQRELILRKKIIEWMNRKGIRSYEKVGKIILSYYNNPKALIELIESGD